MSESQTSQNPQNQNVQFASSQIGTKTAKKHDPFAEQNAKRAQKKAANSKKAKQALFIIIPIIAVALIALIVWLVIMMINKTPEDSDEVVYFTSETVEEKTTKLSNMASDSYDAKVVEGSDGEVTVEGDIDAANAVFDATLDAPQNRDYASQINLARINFYMNHGYYDLVVDYLNQINVADLSDADQAAYYNIGSMAYYYLGDEAKSSEYMRQAQAAQAKLGEFGG